MHAVWKVTESTWLIAPGEIFLIRPQASEDHILLPVKKYKPSLLTAFFLMNLPCIIEHPNH